MAAPQRKAKAKPQSPPVAGPVPVPRLNDPEAAGTEEVAEAANEALPAVRDEDDDGELEMGEVPQFTEAPAVAALDRREVDRVTERIFAAVLSRYGWEQHGNRIEHVGEEDRRRR
jgi:hypothetical protein